VRPGQDIRLEQSHVAQSGIWLPAKLGFNAGFHGELDIDLVV